MEHLFTDIGTADHRGLGVTGCEQPRQFTPQLCDNIVPRQPYLSAWTRLLYLCEKDLSVQSLKFLCFYERTLKFLFLPTCQEERKKIGLCPCLFTRTLRVYWVNTVQLALFLHTSTIGLSSFILSRLTAFLQDYNSEQRDFMSFPSFPKRANLSVDVTKWSVPREAVWQGGLDGKSLALALWFLNKRFQ